MLFTIYAPSCETKIQGVYSKKKFHSKVVGFGLIKTDYLLSISEHLLFKDYTTRFLYSVLKSIIEYAKSRACIPLCLCFLRAECTMLCPYVTEALMLSYVPYVPIIFDVPLVLCVP